MRLSKSLQLSTGAVTINELTVNQVRNIVRDLKSYTNLDLTDCLLNRFDEVVALLDDVLVFSGGASLDGISFSELAEIRQAFTEVNAAFLELVGLSALFQKVETMKAEISTEAVSDLFSEDTSD